LTTRSRSIERRDAIVAYVYLHQLPTEVKIVQYRDYGKIGLRASALGFGVMRLPTLEDGTCDYEQSVPILQRAIERGVNYYDCAWGYIHGTSEVAMGKAIKPYDRQALILATKIPIGDIDGAEWRRRLEVQLQRYETDYIDVMHMHGLSWISFHERALGEDGCLKAARQAQAEGLIRHLAFSSHDTPENVVRLIETGEFDGVTLQYNFLDRRMEEALRCAHERGMGTVIMGPVGGGRLSLWDPQGLRELIPASVTSAPDLAIRWVLSNANVTVALSGMNTLEMVDQNTATTNREQIFATDEQEAVDRLLAKLHEFSNLYCTGCGYCMPCPNGVDIPGNFLLMNYYRVYGLRDYATRQYAQLKAGKELWLHGSRITGKAAVECVQCGACEPKCPQNIPIIDQLEEVERVLGG
jgi:hypothetical protein